MVHFSGHARAFLLAIGFLFVGLTRGQADSLGISVSTSNNPGVGTPVTCPLQLPAAVELALPSTIIDFFDCRFSVAGAGTFEVYGSIFAKNVPVGANGFNSSLGFNATVVADTIVPGNVFVTVTAKQSYAIPGLIASVVSNTQVDGACNTSMGSIDALFFDTNKLPIMNPGNGTPSFPCPTITAAQTTGANAMNGLLMLNNVGSVLFPVGSKTGAAMTLEMQQIAFEPTGGPTFAFNPPPPVPSATCTLPLPGQCPDLMNEFIPPPDPSNGYVIVYAGDVRSAIDINSMINDPTVNAFAYQFPFRSTASMSLDNTGDTEVAFSGPALSSNDIYCYNGPLTCNNNPHFGVNALAQSCTAVTCPTLRVLAQYWTNDPATLLPSVNLDGPGLTGQTVSFLTIFTNVTSDGNTVGQWFTKPYTTDALPTVCLDNDTAGAETLSNAGFLLAPAAILQSMNFGNEPPPGQPGSPFVNLPNLDGLALASGGRFCFTPNINPDIAVTTGNVAGQGVVTVAVNLGNPGGLDASNVTISSIKPVAPATYTGPALPVTVGSITAGTTVSQNIQINTAGMASGSLARFQISGSFQDGAGHNFQFSSVRGVKVP